MHMMSTSNAEVDDELDPQLHSDQDQPGQTVNAAQTLNNVTVVCCEPQGPQNVGSIARLLQNFGLCDLRIVAPLGGATERQVLESGCRSLDPAVVIFNPEVREFATTAGSILDETQQKGVFHTTAEAINDCSFVLGTSVRQRSSPLPFYTLTEAVPRLLAAAQMGRVAVLFGNEKNGLTTRDLQLCSGCIAIPTAAVQGDNPSSLNLSHSVAVLGYELYSSLLGSEHAALSEMAPKPRLDVKGRVALRDILVRALKAVSVPDVPCAAVQGLGEEETQWNDSLDRLLALAAVDSSDTRALFALARRVIAIADLAEKEDGEVLILRLIRAQLQPQLGDLARHPPTAAQLRSDIRRSAGIGLTLREARTVAARLGIELAR
eukprot:EG_transcript_12767